MSLPEAPKRHRLAVEFEAELRQRRQCLAVVPNPVLARADLITLERPFGDGVLRIRYVPDRQILAEPSLDRYLGTLGERHPGPPEALAGTVLEDLANEVVPRWLEVDLRLGPADQETVHRIALVDSQPGWDNAALDVLL